MSKKKEYTERVVTRIAKSILGIETLKARKIDSLDFHDLNVCAIKAALEAAYRAGWERALPRAKKKEIIRAEIEEHLIYLPWDEREEIIKAWAQYPLDAFFESVAAGFLYPDACNPHVNPNAAERLEHGDSIDGETKEPKRP